MSSKLHSFLEKKKDSTYSVEYFELILANIFTKKNPSQGIAKGSTNAIFQ